MTSALATPEGRLFTEPAGAGSARRAYAPAGGRLTLEERLAGALEEARAQGRTECPVCEGPMAPTGAGATCRHCGSSIH